VSIRARGSSWGGPPRAITLCVLLALASGLAAPTLAQQTGRVSGRILDEDTAHPLSLAQVLVSGTGAGAISDVDGRFSIQHVPAGTHDLEVRLLGYALKTVTGVVVTARQTTVIDISLPQQAVEVQELTVSVTDERGTTTALLETRRQAPAVTDAIGQEQISKSPDSDAAAAMQRVPGVSIVDRKFVYVRGLGERYGNTTLDGAILPSPIPDRKAVPLDLVPASFIENVSTSKSYLPSQPADYAGGLVQIETRKVPGENFFKIGVRSGLDSRSTFETGLDYSGGGLDFLGFDDGSRDLPSLIPRDRSVNASNFSPQELEAIGEAFGSTWSGRPAKLPINKGGELAFAAEIPIGPRDLGLFGTANYSDSWGRRSNYVERVFSTSGLADPEVDYAGDLSSHEVTLGGLLNADISVAPRHRLRFSGMLNRVTDDEARVLEGFNLDSNTDQRNTRLQYVENTLFQGRVDGKHYVDVFGGTTLQWRGSYSRAGRYEPNTREVLYRKTAGGVFLFDTFVQSGSVFHQDLGEDAFNGSLDIEFPLRVRGVSGSFQVGGAATRRNRDVYTRRFRFLPQGNLGNDVRAMEPDRLFTPATIAPDSFQIQEATFRPDDYQADLTTLAAYAQLDVAMLPRLRFAGGVRVESTRQNVDPMDLFQTSLEPLQGASLDDTDFVPGATVTWAASDEMNVRFGASRTIARPEFRELAPFTFADFAGGYLVAGNPILERSRITNLDVRWEWFPRPGAVLSVSGFYKKFTDPIEEIVYPSTEFIKSWVNALSARNFGTEIEARSDLGFLSEGFENFALNLNLTLVDSEVDSGDEAVIFIPESGPVTIDVVDRQRRLQGQSAYVVNAGVNWYVPTSGTALTVLYNRFGGRISQVGTQLLPDVLEEPRDALDVVIDQPLGRRFDVKASASNILGSEYRYTQGGDLLRGWEPGRVFSLKLSWQPVGNSG